MGDILSTVGDIAGSFFGDPGAGDQAEGVFDLFGGDGGDEGLDESDFSTPTNGELENQLSNNSGNNNSINSGSSGGANNPSGSNLNSLLALGGSLFANNRAAQSQISAAQNATQAQQAMFNATQTNLAPFISAGVGGAANATALANQGFSFNPTAAQLQQTPGYQFNLQQGEMAAQNSAAARGLGISGQAAVGAEQYASGLASNTYQQQYQNALTNYQTNFGNQLNLANIGENAAAGLGNNATATGQGIASNTTGAGNATAASLIASGNAGQTYANNTLTNQLLQGIYARNGASQ